LKSGDEPTGALETTRAESNPSLEVVKLVFGLLMVTGFVDHARSISESLRFSMWFLLDVFGFWGTCWGCRTGDGECCLLPLSAEFALWSE
jgi:hypothetical protein